MTLEMFKLNDDDEPVQALMRKCGKCRETFPETTKYFYKDHRYSDRLRNICKMCHLRYTNKYVQKNSVKLAFINKKRRAKRRGIEFALDPSIWIPKMKATLYCNDCASEIVWSQRSIGNQHFNLEHSATFDRIDSNIGYVEGNVRLICMKCNSQKSTSPVDEWVGLLEVRVKKGIIPEIDPRLLEFLSDGLPRETQNIIAGVRGTARAPW